MKFILEILKGIIIGLANIIPGVSGGTMMVSMGIYDSIIYAITHIFSEFKNSVKIVLPYAIGMIIAIGAGAVLLTYLFANYSLPTNTAFIGLILGGLPAIVANMDRKKIDKIGIAIGIIFFALVLSMQFIKTLNGAHNVDIEPSFLNIFVMIVVGAIASATMVIPGVSGSMVMMLLGYYDSILSSVSNFLFALKALNIYGILYNVAILLPFGVGVIIGIFFVAKLIEFLLKKFFTYTYCGILGLVLSSPFVVMLNVEYSNITIIYVIVSIITLVLGYLLAYKISKIENK